MPTKISAPDPSHVDVTFALSSPGARAVSLAIFFNQWSVELPVSERPNRDESLSKDHLMVRALMRLQQVTPGQWRCAMPLSPGWYEYLFIVDGAWVMDPEAPEICPDGADGFNAARMVESATAAGQVSRIAAGGARGMRRQAFRRAV